MCLREGECGGPASGPSPESCESAGGLAPGTASVQIHSDQKRASHLERLWTLGLWSSEPDSIAFSCIPYGSYVYIVSHPDTADE